MSESFDSNKFFGSFVNAISWVKVISTLIKILLIVGVVWGIYVVVIKPHVNPIATTKQEAEKIINYQIEPKQTLFGCQHFKIMKDTKVKK